MAWSDKVVTLVESIENKLGSMVLAHSVVVVDLDTTQVAAANANRKYILLVNDSNETIYVKFGEAAVVGEGIRLNSDGGTYVLDGLIDTRVVNAICTSGGKTILVTEG